LVCSCDCEVVVPLVIMLPRHAVVRVAAPGKSCRHSHRVSQRVMTRWEYSDSGRVFADVAGD
ncbi:MAG: hypothetical protein ABI988_20740, partial [Nitrospirota bacterium]